MTASTSRAAKIQENYRRVVEDVAAAAVAAGRCPEEVRLIAVTKYVAAEDIVPLVEAGCRDVGESRPQSLWEKTPRFGESLRWHLIGHLQRNKVRRTLPQIHLLHSLDSMPLTDQIVRNASELGLSVDALLEIRIAHDATKTGMSASDARQWLERYASDESVRGCLKLKGLMGMSSLDAASSQVHREFECLRTSMERWNREFGLQMTELSMGMSQDFAIAIAEGSTMVRIGSRIFEGLPPLAA